jgi:tetratricopeptide (TPR) repeat protein
VSASQLKNRILNLEKKIRQRLLQLLEPSPNQSSKVDVLERARALLAKREFVEAFEHYSLVIKQDRNNLEAYIGASICQLEIGNLNAALEISQKADALFGDHDAILGLITRCKLHDQAWDGVEKYWDRWQKSYSGFPSMNFYQTTGEILVSLLRSACNRSALSDKLLSELVYQDDRSVDSKSHPVICSLLFHWHEYDRPFYHRLRTAIKLLLRQQQARLGKRTLCTVTMLLFAGLVTKDERAAFLKDHFHEFGLYSHWSFVLIGTSWNAIWDESLQANIESVAIVQDLLRSASRNLDSFGMEQLYKLIFIANVCCRKVTPILIEHGQKLLGHETNSSAVREDLAFIIKNHTALVKVQTRKGTRRLKVAVCVSGQLRGWKHALRSWHLIGLADHDVTYIVHTWKDIGGGSPVPPKDERAFPRRFCKEFRMVWNHFGHNEMLSRYPAFFSLWPQNGAEVDLKDLKRTYGTQYVILEDDSTEPFRNMSNSEKMYYKIWACQEAADKLGVQFDLMLRIRPDLEFTEEKEIDWHAIYQASAMHTVLFCEAYSTYFFPNIGFCMPDTFAIATPEVMRGYASAYPMTQRYLASGVDLTEFPQNFIAHKNVAYSTMYHGISVDVIGLPCRFSPAAKPSIEMMLDALYQDARGRSDIFDERLVDALAEAISIEVG